MIVRTAGLKLSIFFAVGVCLFTFAPFVFGAVTTDKDDYTPGETVTISGDGYFAGETVVIEVTAPYGFEYGTTTADGSGEFSWQFTLPNDDSAVGNYSYTATGQTSGLSQSGTFTDDKNLVITFAGTGTGTISFSNLIPPGSIASCTATCTRGLNNNQQATTTATAAVGSVFAGWSGSWDTSGGGSTNCTGTTSPCSFHMGNKAQALTATFNSSVGTLQIVKQAVGGNDTFGFSLSGTTTSPSIATSGGSGTTTLAKLLAGGGYSVTETTVPAGWDFTSSSCTNGSAASTTISAGATTTCTFINTKRGVLSVKKILVNDNGGSTATTSFSFLVNGGSATPFEADGQNDISFAPGAFTVTEAPTSGYATSTSGCTGSVTAGATSTCTITNNDQPGTLIVKKVLINDNGGTAATTTFSYKVNGGTSTFFEADAQNDITENAGSYSVIEDAASGYTTTYSNSTNGSANCTSLSVPNGGSVTCTITNDDVAPTLTLVKTVINDNGGSEVVASFPLFIDLTPVTSGATTTLASNVLYTVSEIPLEGYLPSVWGGDCAADGTITLTLGQVATCTITNDDQPGTLIVKKVLVNDNGGSNATTTFTFQVNAGSSQAFEADGQNDITENAGPYSVFEDTATGYTTTYSNSANGNANCSSLSVPNGGTVTCTITNNDIAPSLTLIKEVSGGSAQATEWTLTADGTLQSPTNLSGNTPVASDSTFKADTYTLDESGPSDYTASAWSCSPVENVNNTVTLGLGQSTTCTITNTKHAHIIVDKVTDPSGDSRSFNFELGGDSNSSFSLTDTDAPNDQTLTPGNYSVGEHTASGWTQTDVSCVSSIGDTETANALELDASETITCTFTNTKNGHIIIVKDTVPNDAQNFTFTNDFGNGNPSPFSLDDDADGTLSNSRDSEVLPGTYSVTEATVAGWSSDGGVCDDLSPVSAIDVAPGETVTCTFTNDDVAPKLTVVKDPTNDSGGNALPDDFQLTVGGNPVSSGVASTLSANIPYAIDETQLPGYTFVSITGDPKCPAVLGGTVTFDEGDDITCTITNDDQPGTLIIKKVLFNNNGGTAATTTFSYKVNGGTSTFFEADAQNDESVAAGLYSVVEDAAAGYTTTYSNSENGSANCNSLTVPNGGSVTCTIVNDDIPTPPAPPPSLPCGCTPHTGTIVSNDSNTVVGDGNAVAVATSSAWTASIPGATWIWQAGPTAPNAFVSFEQSFTVIGTVLSAQLQIASDNSYKVFIDNVQVAADLSAINFTLATQDVYNLTANVTPGTHILRIEVRNNGVFGELNPAGLLYKFEVKTCPPPPASNITVLICNSGAIVNDTSASANTGGNTAGGSVGGRGGRGGNVDPAGSFNNGGASAGNGGNGGNAGAGGFIQTGNASANASTTNDMNRSDVGLEGSAADLNSTPVTVTINNLGGLNCCNIIGNNTRARARTGENTASGSEGGDGNDGGNVETGNGDNNNGGASAGNGGAGGSGSTGGTVLTGQASSIAHTLNQLNTTRIRVSW